MTRWKHECLIRLYDQGNRRPLSYNAICKREKKSHIIVDLLTNPFSLFQAINSLATHKYVFTTKNDMLPISPLLSTFWWWWTLNPIFKLYILNAWQSKHLCNNAQNCSTKKGWKCKLHDQENMIYDWTMQFVSFKKLDFGSRTIFVAKHYRRTTKSPSKMCVCSFTLFSLFFATIWVSEAVSNRRRPGF